MSNNNLITVIKTDYNGKEVWRYEGTLIEEGVNYVILEAFFNIDDRDDGYFVWRRGDRFIEYFYADRWYSIFEIHDVDTDEIKGWYCNFARPALIGPAQIVADDLELDLFVYPDGRMLLRDEDDFEGLPIHAEEKSQVRAALDDVMQRVKEAASPFSALKS